MAVRRPLFPQALMMVGIIIAAGVLSIVYVETRYSIVLEEGDAGPHIADFVLATTDGGTFQLSEHRGKVVVIDLMMISCQACRHQSENLSTVRSGFSETEVVIVSIDIYRFDTEERLMEWEVEHNTTWPHALDRYNEAQTALLPESVRPDAYITLPIIIMIDEDGRLSNRFDGVVTASELSAEINGLV